MAVARVLVSACLLGADVRYHGGSARIDSPILQRWRDEGRIVGVCPEMAGGLGAPREPAEAAGGDGRDVLDGRATVVTRGGRNVTAALRAGADQAVAVARELGLKVAVLKSRSPSCAVTQIYDGTFSGRLADGSGVTAAALQRAGVLVFDETQLVEADAALRRLDGQFF